MQTTLKQSELAKCVDGLSNRDINTWRARGFLNGIGHQTATGRWRYSGSDATALILAEQFRAVGQSPQEAVEKGHAQSELLAAHIRGEGPALAFRFIAILRDGAGGATLPVETIEEVLEEGFERLSLLDLSSIASRVHPRIRTVLRST